MKFSLFLLASLLVGSAFAQNVSTSPDAYATTADAAAMSLADKLKAAADDLKAKLDSKKFVLGSAGENSNGYSPMQCTGHAYCFVEKTQKVDVMPNCTEAGFKWDAKANKCLKIASYMCEDKPYVAMSSDKKSCLKCKADEMIAGGKCSKACKSGYSAVKINGTEFCVEQCKAGAMPMGSDCVKFNKPWSYVPKECATKKCLPGFDLYFMKADKPVAVNYTTDASGKALKAADASYGSSAYAPKDSKAAATCVCALTKTRDIYQQDPCDPPMVVAADPVVQTCNALCPDGKKPFLGKCGKVCPKFTQELKSGMCQYGCPTNFKMCATTLGKAFCATSHPLFGMDSCDVLAKMYSHLDSSFKCKVIKAAWNAKVASGKKN